MRQKAVLFEHDIKKRFIKGGQMLCKLIVPTPERPYVAYNMPDDAYMTGIVMAAMSMKYAVTKDESVRLFVKELLSGADTLCRVTGTRGLLARAFWPISDPNFHDRRWIRNESMGLYWNGDVSTDQMDGLFFGLYYCYKLAADDGDRELIRKHVADLVDYLIKNDLRIVDSDGKTTTWGRYYPEYIKTHSFMNAMLLLQHLKIAYYVTGEKKYDDFYKKMAFDEKYADYSVGCWVPLPPEYSNFSDNVMAAMIYAPLLDLETDPGLTEKYILSLQGFYEGYSEIDFRLPGGDTIYGHIRCMLERYALESTDKETHEKITAQIEDYWNKDKLYHGVKAIGCPLYAYIAKKYLGDRAEEDGVPVKAADTLRYFPLNVKWNKGTIAGYQEEFGFRYDPAPCSPEPQIGLPVPIDRRVKDWSCWVQNPYNSLGSADPDGAMEFNGHDYLIGYWLGRYFGYISARD